MTASVSIFLTSKLNKWAIELIGLVFVVGLRAYEVALDICKVGLCAYEVALDIWIVGLRPESLDISFLIELLSYNLKLSHIL